MFTIFGEAANYISQGNAGHLTHLAEFQLKSGRFFTWPGRSNLKLVGQKWTPVEDQIVFNEVTMEDESTAPASEVSSIPKDFEFARFVTDNFDEEARNRRVVQYMALLDEDWKPLVNQVYAISSLIMDQLKIIRSGEKAQVSISLESPFTTQRTPTIDYYTAYHLKQKYPPALGLDFMSSINDKEVSWKLPTTG